MPKKPNAGGALGVFEGTKLAPSDADYLRQIGTYHQPLIMT
jgi:hypothetical protein